MHEESMGFTRVNRVSAFSPTLEGIVPVKSRKPGEIAICGTKGQTVVDCKRSEMGIRYEIRTRRCVSQQRSQDFLVALSGLRNPDEPTG